MDDAHENPSRPAVTVLLDAVREIERHASRAGWDRPPALYALVETADLRAREPELVARLGIGDDAAPLTPVEQPALADLDLEQTLATIGWPAEVSGCALVLERLVLPAEAEAQLPETTDAAELAEAARTHELRQEARMVAAVLRDGQRECAIRLRAHDREQDVLTGPDLLPALTDALLHTFG